MTTSQNLVSGVWARAQLLNAKLLNAKLFRERQTFSWTPNFFVNANFYCERKYPESDFPHSIPLQKRWFGHHPVPSCSARAQIQRSVFGRCHFPVQISLQNRWLVPRNRKNAKTGFLEFGNLKTQFWERVMFPIMAFYKKRWFGFHIIEHRLFVFLQILSFVVVLSLCSNLKIQFGESVSFQFKVLHNICNFGFEIIKIEKFWFGHFGDPKTQFGEGATLLIRFLYENNELASKIHFFASLEF